MNFKVFHFIATKPITNQQGFTLVEVLVAMIVATTFTLVALQSMVISALLKVRAQEYSEATAWMQKDLEYIKYKASSTQLTSSGTSDSRCSATTSTTGFANTLQGYFYLPGATVTNNVGRKDEFPAFTNNSDFCSSTSVSTPSSSTTSTQSINLKSSLTSKCYQLTRTFTVYSSSPYNILQIGYTVARRDSSDVSQVATLYTEVVPDAAFQCQ